MIKVLQYTGTTETEAYKRNLFAISGIMVNAENNELLGYVPNLEKGLTGDLLVDKVKEATGTNNVELIEVETFEAFKRVFKNLLGREFK